MSKERIVVKIGSSSLTNHKGEIDQDKLTDHVDAIATLLGANHEVILVSSGAVAAGFKKLGYPSRPVTLKGKQAAASVGQSLLIQTYMEKFSEYNITAAQILLTRSDFSNRDRYRNAYATITELLERGIVPIINENDTVSVDELTFGDNDMLSSLVSGFIHADRLIILTDIDGIYDGNPRTNPNAKKFYFLEGIPEDMLERADSTGSKVGTGGMKSKLLAAQTALSLGVSVFIGMGNGKNKLLEIIDGKGNGTYIFNREHHALNTKKQWIALHSESSGKIYVDQGAVEAILYNGKSLLAPGVFKVTGTFEKGDVVEVIGAKGFIGKGEVSCSSAELKNYLEEKYRQGKDNESSLEVIHRDNWVKAKKVI
ncbi:Glutamate 5-kinase [Caldibacillus thermoamylovorans]|uniref:Glutamate 5-kinase n=1 Tax=Caldibacillus thermoamylovorans TaxID=35841 RepID=A0A0D0EN16_9BACI|nr:MULTISPECIES: glutamate 5-kinase [Caldibacillus]AWI11931.1 glutamate 5-kinase [Caldibacillus thermoamylovorans]KIO61545.1 Glutamate 5-kinase [Caldibacillus thermoamylovorans]KIO67938.1 Glutamate 5-kinase [Caldibacillus thermoamylovorans]KIO72562.1 Glutamate 5-kinase [Caldibacillus thermoamylovorans]MCB7070912.1 glutamate 5-kinase [Caldibacillus sp. 210928-DFI.2.22]